MESQFKKLQTVNSLYWNFVPLFFYFHIHCVIWEQYQKFRCIIQARIKVERPPKWKSNLNRNCDRMFCNRNSYKFQTSLSVKCHFCCFNSNENIYSYPMWWAVVVRVNTLWCHRCRWEYICSFHSKYQQRSEFIIKTIVISAKR